MKTAITAILFLLLLHTTISCSYQVGNDDKQDEENVITGRVVKVLDGDTYDLLLGDSETVRIRMEGIDAPERGMPYYKVSKKHLSDLCYNRNVAAKISGHDRYNRLLAYTFMDDGTELGHEMIKAGLAWHYKQYNSDESLAELEDEAKSLKRGLWADKDPVAPWTNRSLRRQGVSTKNQLKTTD